jgi:preprotein translocase subunit SecF
MSIWSDLYNGETQLDFPKQWRTARIVSGALILISVISLLTLRLNLGLEFEGGSSWEVRAPGVSVAEARDVLRPFDQAEAKIQIVDGDVIRIQAPVKDPVEAREIGTELGKLGEFLGVQSVGPSWGDEITKQAVKALVVFFILLALFMAWRLEWKMAVGAIIAVLHDVVISVGVYSVLQLVVTPATVVSFLTIMGYSLYDTIVVFDKARELTSRPSITSRFTYTEIMNTSLNQVLMRSLNTTLMGLFPVIAMLVVGKIQGADTLLEFAVALFVGLVVGAYSSLYVASPIVVWLKEREPKHAAVRERIAARGESIAKRGEGAALVGAAAGAGGGAVSAGGAGSSGGVTRPGPAGAIPPRPRKKKRR